VILVLDNYDSFTWNLVQALEATGARCIVRRSDRITLPEVESISPQGIVLSPGPFGPNQTGICPEVVRCYRDVTPILGVCLGMQVIATVAGADVAPSGHPVHGKASRVSHDGQGVFEGLPNPILAGRYHSLIVELDEDSPLEVTARSPDGEVMALAHRQHRTFGLQFHPESILTTHGYDLIRAFLERVA